MENRISFKTSKYSWLVLIPILLLAAILRLYKIEGYMTFLGDEGRDVLVVYNILHGDFTLLGPTASVGGFFMGPIYYYFMAPFLWLFNYNPVGPAIMVALFGIATVWLVYKVGSEFFGKKTAIIAASLYSISPLVIAYSRSSWNPNLMPFFSLLTVYVLYKAVKKNRIYLFMLTGFLFGITIQLHYISLFLGTAVVFFILLRTILGRLNIISRLLKSYFLILLGFIVGWSPFLGFEFRHGFPNLNSILNFVLHSGETGGNSNFIGTIGNVFFRMFGRLLTNFPPPEQVALGAHANIAAWYYLSFLLGIITASFFVYQLFKSYKKENFDKFLLITLWFFIGIFLFGFYKKPIYDYYFGFMFPLPFLIVGYFISSLYSGSFKNINKLSKPLALLIFLSLVLINFSARPFRYEPNNQMAQVKQISEFVLSKTDNKPYNFALITLGNSDHGYRYFFKLAGKDPIGIQTFQNDPKRETVKDQLLIVCEDPRCQPLGNSLWEVAGFGRAEIAGEWDVSVVKVYKLVHYKGS